MHSVLYRYLFLRVRVLCAAVVRLSFVCSCRQAEFCVQLSSGCKFPVLDPNAGERALLLKDYYGDWGILIGKWEGFRKGKPGTPGKLNVASTSIKSVLYSFATTDMSLIQKLMIIVRASLSTI